ncbi:DUF971 domain-containing protein [Ideonella sp. BN130291]|uniref:DUF971 domain-containing protein n=1 Tax=Ideonella sp. BN130291 TaxID=3112940 RepID=UPI002E25CA57|nr:DUF971 domain-containing protein [Ideonella sp. BN130291]
MNTVLAPEAIELRPDALRLDWHDGPVQLSAARLRAECRCAACRSAALKGLATPVDERVRLAGAAPAGHYGLQLVFDDGHDRGIYPWALLRELAAA